MSVEEPSECTQVADASSRRGRRRQQTWTASDAIKRDSQRRQKASGLRISTKRARLQRRARDAAGDRQRKARRRPHLALRRAPPRQLRRAAVSGMALAVVPGAGRRRRRRSRRPTACCSRRPTSRTSSTRRRSSSRATAPSLSSGSSRTTRRSRIRSSPVLQASDPSFHAYYVHQGARRSSSGRRTPRRATRSTRTAPAAFGGGAGRGEPGVGRRDGGGVEEEEGAERDAARAGAADAHGAEAAGRAAARPRRDPAHRAVRRAQRPHLPDGDREPRGAQPPVRLPQADAPPLLVLHVARRRLLEVPDAARGAARPPRARRGRAVAHAREDPAARGVAARPREGADLEGDGGGHGAPRPAPHRLARLRRRRDDRCAARNSSARNSRRAIPTPFGRAISPRNSPPRLSRPAARRTRRL